MTKLLFCNKTGISLQRRMNQRTRVGNPMPNYPHVLSNGHGYRRSLAPMGIVRVAPPPSGVTLPYGDWRPCWFWCQKKEKKGRHYFCRPLIAFLPPLELFVPQIFFSRRPNAKLARYGAFCYLVDQFFV